MSSFITNILRNFFITYHTILTLQKAHILGSLYRSANRFTSILGVTSRTVNLFCNRSITKWQQTTSGIRRNFPFILYISFGPHTTNKLAYHCPSCQQLSVFGRSDFFLKLLILKLYLKWQKFGLTVLCC